MATKKKSKKPARRGGKATKPAKKRKQAVKRKVARKKTPVKKKTARPKVKAKVKRRPAPRKKTVNKKAVKKAVKKVIKKKAAPAKPKAAEKTKPAQKIIIPNEPYTAPVMIEEVKEVFFTPEGPVEVTETIVTVEDDTNGNPGTGNTEG